MPATHTLRCNVSYETRRGRNRWFSLNRWYSGPKESLKTSFEFNVRQVADATRTAPRRIEITLKGESDEETPMKTEKVEPAEDPAVEITMCDVDEEGNIISSAVISETVYS